MTFKDQVAIITGASTGIGSELVKQLAGQGARVGLVSRRREMLAEMVSNIEKSGGVAACAAADVANRAATVAAIHELAGKLGPVDLLVANAGIGTPTQLDPMNVEDIEKMIRVNLLGVVYSIEAVLPEMLRRQRGHIAAVSSMGAYKGLPGESAYCASKAGVNAYMEGLRIELRKHDIAVTTICPGFVHTPMTDFMPNAKPFLLQADEAARRIVRALARRKKVFNFPRRMNLLMALTRWLPDWLIERIAPPQNQNPRLPEHPF